MGAMSDSEEQTHQLLTELRALRERVADLAAIESQRRLTEETLRRRTEELEALRQVGLMLASDPDLHTLLHTIVSQAIALAGGTAGGLYLYRPERDVLEWAVAIGHALPPIGSLLRRGEGSSGKVWESGQARIVDDYQGGEGRSPRHEGNAWTAAVDVPLQRSGKFLGVLNVLSENAGAFGPADAELLSLFASQAAVAIDNAALYEAERTARRQLRDLAGYLQTAREKERTHIAREIHDEFGQILTALKMDLSWLSRRLPGSEAHLVEKAAAMSDLIDAAIHTVRRVATELRPGLLDDLGLVPAIEWQAEQFAARTGIAFELHLGEEELVLDRDLATAIFRIFQETLTNVGRHAEATQVRVHLETSADELVLTVQDDGIGITVDQISDPTSLGLVGMRERAHYWGGDVALQGRPGQGTAVTVRVPLPPLAISSSGLGKRASEPAAEGEESRT